MAVKMIQAKGHGKKCSYLPYYNGEIGFFANKQILIIRLPHSRIMKVIARSVLLALVVLSLPWLGSYIRNNNMNLVEKALLDANFENHSMKFEFLPTLFNDLTEEGLYKSDNHHVFLTNGEDDDNVYYSQISTSNEMNMISITDTHKQNGIREETIDFIFTLTFEEVSDFIERVLKTDGIVVVELASDDSILNFRKPENYNIVYIRRFDSTIIAMKKNSNIAAYKTNSQTQRRLFGLESIPSPEAKKAAQQNLEDVLLEPPRASSGKSSRYLKRTRFLPDLLNDTLEKYSRRVFIDVGLPEKKGGSGTSWFDKNYPTRNLHFEKYKIETLAKIDDDDEEDEDSIGQVGMSDWLRKNVKENEYVVMKAEAEVVYEMVNSESKAIRLVDELFLDCKPARAKRAYWECLALYGRLRDEGVAVHQWWG